jgi:hypothetical protein
MIITDVTFLVIETEKSLNLPNNIWYFKKNKTSRIMINQYFTIYFFIEFLLRLFSYDAFGETLKEFITSIIKFII